MAIRFLPRPSFLLILALGSCGGSSSPVEAERLVLITVDTLRYDHFDGPRAAMPRLAQAGQAGLVFERCYAVTPVTQPTHSTLLTGALPWVHGVTRNGQVLDDSWTTLAERLTEEGFATAAVVASFPLEHRFGFAQGFDRFEDTFSQGRPAKATEWEGIEPDWKHFFTLADEIAERALAVLDAMPPGKQFLWVHFYDPHSPYGDSQRGGEKPVPTKALTFAAQAGPQMVEEMLALALPRYGDDVRAVDRAIGRLLDRLAEDSMPTHVIVTADHGESFGEDGSFGHGDQVTESQLHVPLVVLSPRVTPGARGDTVGSVDIHQTLLSLVGLGPTEGTGRDLLLPVPADPVAVGMRRTYTKDTKEVRADGSIAQLSGLRFFLARGDDLIAGNAEAVEGTDDAALGDRARRAFAAFEQALGEAHSEDLDDDVSRKALEELGYVR